MKQENTMNKKADPTPVELAQQELEEFGELVWGPELLRAVRNLPVDADPATYKIADLENDEVIDLFAESILPM